MTQCFSTPGPGYSLSPDVCFCDWDQVSPGEDGKWPATVLELRVTASVEICEGISDAAAG